MMQWGAEKWHPIDEQGLLAPNPGRKGRRKVREMWAQTVWTVKVTGWDNLTAFVRGARKL